MHALSKKPKEILDTANKLIFVKQYENALRLLEELLVNDEDAKKNCLVHLRRIELACRLSKVSSLLPYYEEELALSRLDPHTGELCVAMVKQHGQLVPISGSIKTYTEIILKYGESPAAYYGIALALDAEGNSERALFNYQQSVKLDSDWYPSYFGISQILYHKKQTDQANHYFYQFEERAPYNLYGNIETHRKLSDEFLEKGQFQEAEAAIRSLSEWWIENRKHCPREISVLEALILARIEEASSIVSTPSHLDTARNIVNSILDDKKTQMEELSFLAETLNEFGQIVLGVKVYKKLLDHVSHDVSLVQKIGLQFLSLGELNKAYELFESAADSHPDDPTIRFCLLSTRLKMADLDIEQYLHKKERATHYISEKEDSKKILDLLNDLIATYPEDSETHKMCGDVYLDEKNVEFARAHFEKMYQLDPKSVSTALHYVTFLINYDYGEEGLLILKKLSEKEYPRDVQAEIHATYSRYFNRKGDYESAVNKSRSALDLAPWNAVYLCQIIHCQLREQLANAAPNESLTSTTDYTQLSEEDWVEFDRNTKIFAEDHQTFLVYNRCKLRLLSSGGKLEFTPAWVHQAIRYNPTKAAQDLLKLLNTNFDSPSLYWALGVLFRESGSLEIAEMWFEQLVDSASTPNELRLLVRLDLSDCYIWRGVHLQKALAYLKIVKESKTEQSEIAQLKMAHAYLKLGEVRSARVCLDAVDSENPSLESAYLKGLLHYRDGNFKKAKMTWKPFLTTKAMHIREHWIKKEILEFYFQGKSYIKTE